MGRREKVKHDLQAYLEMRVNFAALYDIRKT